jgi:hypothetical protein
MIWNALRQDEPVSARCRTTSLLEMLHAVHLRFPGGAKGRMATVARFRHERALTWAASAGASRLLRGENALLHPGKALLQSEELLLQPRRIVLRLKKSLLQTRRVLIGAKEVLLGCLEVLLRRPKVLLQSSPSPAPSRKSLAPHRRPNAPPAHSFAPGPARRPPLAPNYCSTSKRSCSARRKHFRKRRGPDTAA